MKGIYKNLHIKYWDDGLWFPRRKYGLNEALPALISAVIVGNLLPEVMGAVRCKCPFCRLWGRIR